MNVSDRPPEPAPCGDPPTGGAVRSSLPQKGRETPLWEWDHSPKNFTLFRFPSQRRHFIFSRTETFYWSGEPEQV